MKATIRIVVTCAKLLSLVLLASLSFAANKPLLGPAAIALDGKGNLYVANGFGGNVLVYSPNYVQLTAKTITQGIEYPSGLAIDASGNVWVSNIGPAPNYGSTITVYTKGIQNTNATITTTQFFYNLAFDGNGNLYVNVNNGQIDVYAAPSAFELPSVAVQSLIPPGRRVEGMAVARGTIVFGDTTNKQLDLYNATQMLTSGAFDGFTLPSYTGISVAADVNGNFYVGNVDGTVNLVGPGGQTSFLTLSYYPNAIAADSVRGRVYIASSAANSIYVYSTTTGQLLHTIQ